jgi:hypothetical protein
MADATGLDPNFQTKIDQMIAASHGRLFIKSGYRSGAEQTQLYQAAVKEYGQAQAGNWVAPPGHSNHERGLAVDLGGDIGLAHQLAPQFGLEFPMNWEPWHVEPVGLREHPTTSPQAYTQGPPGSVSPTNDPLLNASTPTLLARLSSVLSGAGIENVAGTGGAGTTTAAGTTGAQGSAAAGGSGATGTVALQSGAAGGDKRLPGHTIQDWAKDVLTGLGAPVNQQNLDTMVTWANTESGGYNPSVAGGKNNPLNTTEGAVGYSGQGGSQGNIKDFGSYDQGVQAIVHNLTQTKGAGYENILNALHQSDPQAVFSAVNGSAFGTHFGGK